MLWHNTLSFEAFFDGVQKDKIKYICYFVYYLSITFYVFVAYGLSRSYVTYLLAYAKCRWQYRQTFGLFDLSHKDLFKSLTLF